MWRLRHIADDDNDEDNDNVILDDGGNDDDNDEADHQFPSHGTTRWNQGATWCSLQRSCLASNNMFSMRFTEELREFQQSVRRESDAKIDIYFWDNIWYKDKPFYDNFKLSVISSLQQGWWQTHQGATAWLSSALWTWSSPCSSSSLASLSHLDSFFPPPMPFLSSLF